MKTFMFENEINAALSKAESTYEQLCNTMNDLRAGRFSTVAEKKAANENIRQFALDLVGLNDTTVKSPRAYRKAMKKNGGALFEILEDTVQDMLVEGWGEDPFFMQFVEVRNLSDGDSQEFVLEDDVDLTVHKVSGGNHDYILQTLRGGSTFTIGTARYGAAIGADIRSYLLGKVDFARLMQKVYEAFDEKLKAEIYTELQAVGTKLPANSGFNKALAITTANKADIDTLIEDVNAANGNVGVIVLGLESTLKKFGQLTDVDWISSDAKNELYHTGKLGVYEGTPLVGIPQMVKKKGTGVTKLISPDQILILPAGMDRPIKLVDKGDTVMREVNSVGDYQDDLMSFEMEREWGVETIVGKWFGVITVSGA